MRTQAAGPAKSSKLTSTQFEHVRARHLSLTVAVVDGTETLQIAYVDSCGEERCPLPLRINMFRCHTYPCPGIVSNPGPER